MQSFSYLIKVFLLYQSLSRLCQQKVTFRPQLQRRLLQLFNKVLYSRGFLGQNFQGLETKVYYFYPNQHRYQLQGLASTQELGLFNLFIYKGVIIVYVLLIVFINRVIPILQQGNSILERLKFIYLFRLNYAFIQRVY